MIGLDAAGKTTILYKLKLGEGEVLRPFLSYCCIYNEQSLINLIQLCSCDDNPNHWIQC